MDFLNREKYGVVVTENLQATQWGGHIVSLIDESQDVQNGWFGHVGFKFNGEREISEFVTPTTASLATKPAVLVANPVEIFYAPTPEGMLEYYFINLKGKIFRAYNLYAGDEFALTEYTVDTILPYDKATNTGGAVAGNFVVLQDGSNRLLEVAAEPTGVAFYGEIIDVDSTPIRPYIMINGERAPRFIGIRVVKNSV